METLLTVFTDNAQTISLVYESDFDSHYILDFDREKLIKANDKDVLYDFVKYVGTDTNCIVITRRNDMLDLFDLTDTEMYTFRDLIEAVKGLERTSNAYAIWRDAIANYIWG